jgi:phosphoglycerate dehydrogenase-like enzyme
MVAAGEGALLGARKVSFDELLAVSDIVSLHAPAETFEQRHILVVMENISNFLRIANSLLPVSCLKTS